MDSQEHENAAKRKRHVEWNPLISYQSKDELSKYIATHDCFYEHSSNEADNGRTTYYYCNKVPARSARLCPVKLKVFESSNTVSFGVSVTTFVHDHSKITNAKKTSFSEAVKKETYTMKTDFSMKPKLIQKHLLRTITDEPIPNVAQIRRILNEQVEKYVPPTISYGQLHEWCKQQEKFPQDIDEPFVLGHFFENAPEESFAFVVSTRRLLENAVGRQNASSDGTYKIMWQGFPLITIGFLDRLKHYHILAICVTARERKTEYVFAFRTIKNAVKEHTNGEFNPTVLISDAAPAIRNAFYEVFESAKQNVICYIHVQRNISKQSYKTDDNKKLIMQDFLTIQKSAHETEFDKACELFIKKWTPAEPEFCAYFPAEWLRKDTKNWYDGYSPFVPAHNNGQEGFNLHIKRDHTMRERLPFNTFKVVLNEMIRDMSERYDPLNPTGEVKKIRNLPNITNKLFEAAHSWYMNTNTIIGSIQSVEATFRTFVVASSKYLNNTSSPSLNDLNAIHDFDDFDSFILNGVGMQYTVHVKNDANLCFIESTCMCASFHQNFICKHIVGLAFHLKLKKVPKSADSTMISKKQPRGRAAKAKKALVKQ